MEPKPRIALLIDAENVSSDHAAQIFRAVSALGDPFVRRSYGDWSNGHLAGWQAVGRVRGIREVQHSPCASRKNASDIALAVDAVDLIHTLPVDAFAIVSGDSDFTPLATLLRERGRPVHGFGDAQASAAFRAACTSFVELATPVSRLAAGVTTSKTRQAGARAEPDVSNVAKKASAKMAQRPAPPQPLTSQTEARLRAAIRNSAGADGWASLSVFGKHVDRDIRPQNHGHRTWLKLFADRKGFQIRVKPHAAVRLTI